MRDLFFSIRAKDLTGAAFDKVKKGLSTIDGAMAGVAERANRMGEKVAVAGGILAGITAPVVLAFRDSLSVWDAQEQALARVEQAVRRTGGAAGFTAQELRGHAKALSEVSRFGDQDIMGQVVSSLLTFDKVRGDVFLRAQTSVADMATVLGTDLQGLAMTLGEALNDPAEGLSALGEAGIVFTERQTKLVEKLVETGRVAEAQGVILDEVARRFGGQAAAAAEAGIGPLIQWQNTWTDVKEVVGGHIAELMPTITGFLGGVADQFTALPDPMQKAAIAFTVVTAAVGALALAVGALMVAAGPVTVTLTLVAGAAAAVTAAVVSLSGASETLQSRTDDLVLSVADEVQATAALSGVLDSGIAMSQDTATAKMREAQARYENVKAVIAEHRALVQGSAEYKSAIATLKSGGLNTYGPGPTGHIDPELYRIGAIGRRVDGESQMAMDALNDMATPPELLKTLSEAEAQIERLKGLGAETGSALGGLAPVTLDLGGALDGLGDGKGGGSAAKAAGGLKDLGKDAEVTGDKLDLLLDEILASKGELDGFGRETSDMFKAAFGSGRDQFESFGDFVLTWGNKLLDRMLSSFFDPLGDAMQSWLDGMAGTASAGGGGGAAAILGGVGDFFGGLMGFDTGGEMAVGGRAGIDRNVAAFKVTRGETIKVTKRGESDADGGGAPVAVQAGGHVSMGWDSSMGAFVAYMQDAFGNEIARAQPMIVSASVGQVRRMAGKSKSFFNNG